MMTRHNLPWYPASITYCCRELEASWVALSSCRLAKVMWSISSPRKILGSLQAMKRWHQCNSLRELNVVSCFPARLCMHWMLGWCHPSGYGQRAGKNCCCCCADPSSLQISSSRLKRQEISSRDAGLSASAFHQLEMTWATEIVQAVLAQPRQHGTFCPYNAGICC